MNLQKIKILFLINTLTGGGAEKVLVDLVNNLDVNKYDITVQTVIDKGVNKNYLSPNIRYKTINNLRNVYLCKIWAYLTSFIIPPKLTYNFFIKDNYKYEVAFLEGVPTKLISVSSLNNPIKYAWVHTDMILNYGQEKVFKTLLKHQLCYKKLNTIFCVSESVKDSFLKLFGQFDNIRVLYNPIDNKNIIIKANELLNEITIPKCMKFVTVGRLCEEKGFERLLQVCDKLVKSKYDFVLWILGEGPQYDLIEKYIKNNNLTKNVFLLGFQKNPYKFIKNADFFISSSLIEGYSTVVTESVIIGTPVLTTECAGMREILGDSEYGYIVENSKEALYQGMKELLTNEITFLKFKDAVNLRKDYFELSQRINEIEKQFI